MKVFTSRTPTDTTLAIGTANIVVCTLGIITIGTTTKPSRTVIKPSNATVREIITTDVLFMGADHATAEILATTPLFSMTNTIHGSTIADTPIPTDLIVNEVVKTRALVGIGSAVYAIRGTFYTAIPTREIEGSAGWNVDVRSVEKQGTKRIQTLSPMEKIRTEKGKIGWPRSLLLRRLHAKIRRPKMDSLPGR